jgi:hypothetical protein
MKSAPVQEQKTDSLDTAGVRDQVGDAENSAPSANGLLAYQQKIGNRAFGRVIQAKLKVGAPDDAYEREADRIADLVMRMPDPGIQRKPT